jgi:DNA-binding transcriptional MerR regulator
MSTRDYFTIGEIVQKLQGVHPELTISKVRFLEDEGLITPERTAGGYRKFSQADVARIEMILRLQKEHFLPLAVIREKLAEYDRGRVPAELQRVVVGAPEPVAAVGGEDGPLPVQDALSALGIPVSFVEELVEFGVIRMVEADGVKGVDRADVPSIHSAWDLRRFGVEPRHLRMYESFAEREAALFAQIVLPTFRHKTAESRQRLSETLTELGGLTDQLKGRLLRRALADAFDDFV